MDRAWFEYKGINSIDKYIHIENDISFPSPEADVDFVKVLGRDGEVAIDNKRFKNVTFSLPVRIKTPDSIMISEIAAEISEWLKEDVGWGTLRFSGSPDYEYVAICHSRFDINETLRNYGKTVIQFTVKPYKQITNQQTINVSNGGTLINPTIYNSKPLIKVTGTGDIKVKNNNVSWLSLKNVDGLIEIDTEKLTVYERDWKPAYNKMLDLGSFPELGRHENTITWTGDVQKIEILPRWGVLM